MAALLKGDQVELEQGMFGGKPMHARITKLTLHFVKAVEVAAPVRELLDPAAPLLYGFPG